MSRKLIDKGIDWIGLVPDDWNFQKGKYLFQQRSERGNSVELQLLSPTQKFGCIPQSLYEELTGANAVKLNEKTNLNLLKTIHVGDYCISLRSFQGGFEYSNYEGVVSPAYQVFYPIGNNICRGYYKYMFKDGAFIDKMNSFTLSLRDGKNIAFADFGNTLLPLPSFSEQQAIADYLDKKTAEIDAAITESKSLIDKYKAYKQSIITEAVTKGLKPNVKMKDSGIEWIGEIPEQWKVARVETLFTENVSKNIFYEFDHALKFTYGELVPKNEAGDVSELKGAYLAYSIIDKNDIAINGLNLNFDFVSQRVARCPQRGILTSAYLILKPNDPKYSQFYTYQFKSWDNQKVFHGMGKGVRLTLSFAEIKKMLMPIPSMEEQQQIANYLDTKCSQIDTIISQKEHLVTQLQEYKKSIIFEYVTGKKEVPNAQ